MCATVMDSDGANLRRMTETSFMILGTALGVGCPQHLIIWPMRQAMGTQQPHPQAELQESEKGERAGSGDHPGNGFTHRVRPLQRWEAGEPRGS